jgi:hypothetical protein
MIFCLVLKLEISYRVIISWRFLVLFRGFFEDFIFAWWNIWVCHIFANIWVFSIYSRNTFQRKWQGHTVWHTPCYLLYTLSSSCSVEHKNSQKFLKEKRSPFSVLVYLLRFSLTPSFYNNKFLWPWRAKGWMSKESRNSCNLAQNFINNKGTKSREEVEVPNERT